jgi:transcriptional/translational regulatory protein YebC/TACO1
MLVGLEAGMEDLDADGDRFIAWCDPPTSRTCARRFEGGGFEVAESGSTMVPASTVPIAEVADAKKVLRLMDALDDNDDVQDVYANFDIPEELIEELEQGADPPPPAVATRC